MSHEVKLTKNDRLILESYKPVIRNLAAYFSTPYEFVLHSLEDYDHSVIEIVNGEHTGRTVGAPITDLALKMLDRINDGDGNQDAIIYFSHNRKGEPLKSTTIAIRGDHSKVIGLLCINMYLNSSFSEVISSFVSGGTLLSLDMREDFTQKPENLIRAAYENEKESVLADDTILPSNKNKVIIEHLYDKGVFRFKDSVVVLENMMGISKNTIYMHIRNYKKALKSKDE